MMTTAEQDASNPAGESAHGHELTAWDEACELEQASRKVCISRQVAAGEHPGERSGEELCGYSMLPVDLTRAVHTWDLVTAQGWTGAGYGRSQYAAVAIIDGLSAVQPDADRKCEHQAAFPQGLLEQGVAVCSAAAQASVATDRVALLASIGNAGERLDETICGVIAAVALPRALSTADEAWRTRCFEAFQRGHVRTLHLALGDSVADTAETWGEVRAALDTQSVSVVAFQTGLPMLPSGFSFCGLGSLTSVDLSNSSSLRALPEVLFHECAALAAVTLRGCTGLGALPDRLFAGCAALAYVNLCGCTRLAAVPIRLFRGCTTLAYVDLRGCGGLTRKLIERLRSRGVTVKRGALV